MIRVFVVDDSAAVRRGLGQLIEGSGDMVLAGEAADGRALLDAAAVESWDVLILDLSLPRVSGLEALKQVRALRPELPIVALSMYADDVYGPPVLRAGASAYLSKDRSGADLLSTVRAVARGDTPPPPSPAPEEELLHETLTGREYQTFTLLIHGRSIAEIAAELDLGAEVVSAQLEQVQAKLGATSVAEVIDYAHRMGFIG